MRAMNHPLMNLTKALRNKIEQELPMEHLLPDRLPIYVSSFVYMFGILTMASFILVILSGMTMAFEGPLWYQFSAAGAVMRSIHFAAETISSIFPDIVDPVVPALALRVSLGRKKNVISDPLMTRTTHKIIIVTRV